MSMNPCCQVCDAEDAETVHCSGCPCPSSDLRAERDEMMNLAKQAQARVDEALTMLRDVKAERDAARAECHRWAEKCEDIAAEWRKSEEAEAAARAEVVRLAL